jgi:spermidine synthase
MSDDSRYLVERLNRDFGYYLRSTKTLAHTRSPFQDIEIFESPLFGRAMRIDQVFMTSERDEFFYHENMIHVPCISHPRPESALIVGGGDGGAAEELLKHRTMRRVVMAELDQAVVDVSKRWLGDIHRGAFDDPRLDVRIMDGKAYIESGTEQFDVIIMDLTDPFGPAQALYTADFYTACRRALKPGGVINVHLESPIHRPRAMARIVKSLQGAFSIVRPYLVYVPLYGTWWSMASASDTVDPLLLDEQAVDARILDRGLTRLQYYSGATHRAVFALPNFVREILARPEKPVTLGERIEDVDDPAELPELEISVR